MPKEEEIKLDQSVEESSDELVQEIAKDIKKYGSLEAIYHSEGGQLLVTSNIRDIVSAIEALSIKYQTLTLQEFIALSAEIKTKLDIVRAIANSVENKALAVEALKETLLAS